MLNDEECLSILNSSTSGVLACLGDDGYPYAVPLSYAYCGGCIYFHCAPSGHKLDAIMGCDKASFTVVANDDVAPLEFTTKFRSVICFGRVSVVQDDDEKLFGLRLLGDKYAPGHTRERDKEIDSLFPRTVVLKFEVQHMSGKEAIELVRERKEVK